MAIRTKPRIRRVIAGRGIGSILPIALSAATVILAILTIAVFIFFGGNIFFYLLFLMAITVSLYNIMLISKLKKQ